MKTKIFILSFLVFMLGSSFIAIGYHQKTLLVKGKIIVPSRWKPNGYIQFYVNHKHGKIQSLNLRGRVWIFSKTKQINIENFKKDTLTEISLGESLDKKFSLKIDSLFNENGGTIYSSITDITDKKFFYHIEVIKEGKYFKAYRKKINDSVVFQRKYFNEITIELDSRNNIKKYRILPD